MKRLFACSVVVALVAALAVSVPAEGDDMAIDPVCGMNVHTKDPKVQSFIFQGEPFYFCNQTCFVTFKKDPGKFASAVQYLLDRSYSASIWSHHKLEANEDMEIYVEILPLKPEAKAKPTKVEIDENETQLIPVKGAPLKRKFTFKAKKEAGQFGAKCRFVSAGRLEIKVIVTFDDGKSDGAVFKLAVLPPEGEDTGHEYDSLLMDMTIQHETMRKTGLYWKRTGEALEGGKAEDARKSFALVKEYQHLVEHMVPHVNEDDMDDFKAINAEYAKNLAEMEGVLKGDDLEKSKEAWKKVDALSCTGCHMKYRWDTFQSRNNYPTPYAEKVK